MDPRRIILHFDRLAEEHDCHKRKKRYYYESLERLYSLLIPNAANKRILEIGCGTGGLISAISPKEGLGIDPSAAMVRMARKNAPHLHFKVMSAENLNLKGRFDYIILADVIEHLYDVERAVRRLERIAGDGTTIIITMANPLWEPLLLLGEKLGLKMPEGDHYRISSKRLRMILRASGFKVVERGWRLIFPMKVFPFYLLNGVFYQLPGIKRLGLVEYLVIRRGTS